MVQVSGYQPRAGLLPLWLPVACEQLLGYCFAVRGLALDDTVTPSLLWA